MCGVGDNMRKVLRKEVIQGVTVTAPVWLGVSAGTARYSVKKADIGIAVCLFVPTKPKVL